MSKCNKVVVSVFLSLFLFGCGGEPTVDGSSERAIKTSLNDVYENLKEQDPKKGQEFQQSLKKIMVKSAIALNFDGVSQEETAERIRDNLDGLTGDEIIENRDDIIQKIIKG